MENLVVQARGIKGGAWITLILQQNHENLAKINEYYIVQDESEFILYFLAQNTSDKSQLWLLPGTKRAALYLTMSQEGEGIFYRSAHNLVNFWARSPKFCMVVTLDWALKYKLLRGVRCGGFRGNTNAITRSHFEIEVPNCI